MKLHSIQIFPEKPKLPKQIFSRVTEGGNYTESLVGFKKLQFGDGSREWRICLNFILFAVKFLFIHDATEKEIIESFK